MNISDDIIGHATVLRLLTAWADKPANGYVFCGPAQVGKRTVAERFVAALLEKNGSTKVRIGDENTNVRIANTRMESHPDFILLDVPEGKKDIPVELVRSARAQLSGRPMVAPRRVLFIPRADRLNEEGVNVLLKVVEEPPAGAVCVMIVQDLSRLPATLQSRMVKVPLNPVPRREIEAALVARGMSPDEAACAAVECRGRPGRIEGSGEQEVGSRGPAFSFQLSASRSLGEWLEIIDRAAKQCESADDAQAAWSNLLDEWAAISYRLPPTVFLVLGQGILTARRFIGGALSPRLPLEAAVTRLDDLRIFPTHISSQVPKIFQ